MPFSQLRLRPGVNTELTPSQVEAGYADANLIRYRAGLAEKLGGWTKYYPFAVGGVPKAMHAWQDLDAIKYLAVGSTGTGGLLGVISNDTLIDISPQIFESEFAQATTPFSTTNLSTDVTVDDPNVDTITIFDAVEFLTPVAVGGVILQGVYPVALNLGTTTYRIVDDTAATATVTGGLVPEFTTTLNSPNVNVELAAHGLAEGSTINLPIATTVGGITILGTYEVRDIIDPDNFTITGSTQATSATSGFMNGGDVFLKYYISLGPGGSSTGYGIGDYGEGGYGTGSPSAAAQTGAPVEANDWTLDNWGELLVATPENGGIWVWEPNAGFSNAQFLAANEAPPYNTGSFIAAELQILIAYGSTQLFDIGLKQDPLLVKWSDQGNFQDFRPEQPGSQAGERRLSGGSRIVGGMSAPQFNLLWTDIGLWTMSYIRPPFVFGFNPVGFGCGLIAKHAVARLGANIYWQSPNNFFVLAGGAPVPIPCTVWDYCFQDLNPAAADRCFAWPNSPFNEVFFFFPRLSTGATEPDAYVKVNVMENAWDKGVMARSAGIDASLLGQPISAQPDGLLFEHETSPDADGAALTPSFRTGLYQLSEGQDLMFVDWVLPDMRWQSFGDSGSASVQFTLYAYEYLSSTPTVHGPFTVSQSSPFFNCRVRARFIALEVSSSDVGSFWRLGGSRFRLAMSGRR